MSDNAKNQLLELLQNLGCKEDCAKFQSQLISSTRFHHSTVTVTFPDGRVVRKTGEGKRRSDADIAAAAAVLDCISNNHPDLIIDWDALSIEAQAGDALIKLGAYLSKDLKDAKDKSVYLQKMESDPHLARVFDHWKSLNDLDLAIWGSNLGEKKKSTLIEALLWRRFGMQIINADASIHLQSLLGTLEIKL